MAVEPETLVQIEYNRYQRAISIESLAKPERRDVEDDNKKVILNWLSSENSMPQESIGLKECKKAILKGMR